MPTPEQNEVPTPPNDRDGNWLDKWGCCKVCDGEIPAGHQEHCDIYKLEQKVYDAQKQLIELRQLADGFQTTLNSFIIICADQQVITITKSSFDDVVKILNAYKAFKDRHPL